jgi:hypothetical protein
MSFTEFTVPPARGRHRASAPVQKVLSGVVGQLSLVAMPSRSESVPLRFIA